MISKAKIRAAAKLCIAAQKECTKYSTSGVRFIPSKRFRNASSDFDNLMSLALAEDVLRWAKK